MKSLICSLFIVVILVYSSRAQTPTHQPISIGEAISLHSDILDEKRPMRIYVPPSYTQTEQAYPVVYVLDGEVAFLHTASAVQFLALYGKMPEAIVVAVHNTDRWRDMPIPDNYGRGTEAAFLRFLSDELVPYIDQTYRTHPLHILIGHSQGGLFSAYAMTQTTSPFQWYISMDAPLFGAGEAIKNQIIALAQDPSYAGRLVTVDRTLGWKKEWTNVETAAHPSFVHAQVLVGRNQATHETLTYTGTYDALEHLFSDYAPADITTKNLPTLQAEYAERSARYGYSLAIPRRLLLRNIDDLLFQMRGVEARTMLTYTEKTFGETEQTQRLQQRVGDVIAEGPLDETVDDILNYDIATPEAMAPYLGTWTGQVKDRFPMDAIVSFKVIDGNVVGYTDLEAPDGGAMRRIDHVMIRVLEDGSLEFGYMNQMRPRGVITYRGHFQDGIFIGKMEMRGVKLTPPPGVEMRDVFIELERMDSNEP